MNDFDEQGIRAALDREVDRLDVPAPPVGQLLTGGRAAARTRRRRIGVGMAAAVMGIAIGGAVVTQPGFLQSQGPVGPVSPNGTHSPSPSPEDTGPETVADLPKGDLPGLPYTEGETVHAGGKTFAIDQHVWLRVGGDVIVTYRLREEPPQPVHLFDPTTGGESLLAESAAGPPVVSVDGRFVAWPVDSGDRNAHVAVWSVADGSPMDTVTFPFNPTCCDNPFRLLGIDAQGRVYGAGGDTTWIAKTSEVGPPVVAHVVHGLRGGFVTEVTPDGVVATIDPTSKYAPPTLLTGRVEPDGSFTEATKVPGFQATVSWDGSSMAYVDADEVLRVLDLASGDENVMRLPVSVSVVGLIWENATSLLVQTVPKGPEGPEAWVRCYTDTGACELATMLGASYGVARR